MLNCAKMGAISVIMKLFVVLFAKIVAPLVKSDTILADMGLYCLKIGKCYFANMSLKLVDIGVICAILCPKWV